MAPLKLYHYSASPPSRCALLTIRNLQLDAEIIVVDLLNQAQKDPAFVKINPQHTVPTIDDNGFVLWESRAIATYLVSANAPGSSLYPSDVKKKAIVDARLYFDQALQLAMGGVIYPVIREGATSFTQAAKDKVYQLLGNFNTFLEGKKYATGDELTVADLAILATASTIYHLGANFSKFSNLSAWYKRLESVPGFAENEEGAKFLGDFVKARVNLTGSWDD